MSREKNSTTDQNFVAEKTSFSKKFFQSKLEKFSSKNITLTGNQSKKIDPTKTLIIILSSLPVLIGFVEFLNQKYSASKKGVFFEKNLPGLSFPTQKIHWETFQYLNQNKKIFSQQIDKDIYLFDRNILIATKNNSGDQKLIASLKKLDSQIYRQTWQDLSLQKPTMSSWESYYQKLDELPFKLQSTNVFEKTDLTNYQKIFNSPRDLQINSKQTTPFINFALPSKNELAELLGVQKYYPQKNLKSRKNLILHPDQKELFVLEKLFTTEIKKGFFNNYFNEGFDVSKVHASQLKKLLFQSEDNKIQSRLMSGYLYPDMNLVDIITYHYQKKFSPTNHIQIELPPSYLLPIKGKKQDFSIPKYLIKTSEIILYNFDDDNNRKIVYQGPAIAINSKNGFDWKVKNTNLSKNSNLRNWLEKILGPTNSRSSNIMNFFGVFESTQVNAKTLKQGQQGFYWFENLPRFRTGELSHQTFHSPSNNLLPKKSFYSIPAIGYHEWKHLRNEANTEKQDIEQNRERYKQKLEVKHVQFKPEKAKKLNFLPILELTTPQRINKISQFSTNNFADFEYLPFTHASLSQHKNSHGSLNHFWDSLDNSNLLSSGNYHKLPSIFNSDDNSNAFFSRNWEPLTVYAWLSITKLSFGLLFFNILKILAVNYGKELLQYLVDLVALLGVLDPSLKEEIEYLIGKREKGFRIIKNTKQNFNNIAGIQNILVQIIEIVWFLRNSGREFKLSKNIPRGILLTGPPGTGKTILVQSIAGEAQVPVFAISGSSLLEPGESGAVKLQILFEEARKSAPCIVFIDEVDTLAQKREQMTQTRTGTEEILDTLSQLGVNKIDQSSTIFSKTGSSEDVNSALAHAELQKEKLRLLLQFLVELDGIKTRSGVVVIAATNRPEILDPAVLRPGRFDKIIDLGLPGPEKRKEIFKLYSSNLGVDNTISWDYLTHRTAGYSAADIAGIMNQSTLYAILKESCHTIETIEYGIDRITTLEKPIEISKQNSFALQLAYYQAGKILLSRLLKHHPPAVVAHLWPRRPNARALQISQNLQTYLFRFARRVELEHRLIGCYAGKAAEILFLENGAQDAVLNLSDYGLEDIQFAQNLSQLMIKEWLFYTETLPTQENSEIPMNFNAHEYRNQFSEKTPFLNNLLNPLESDNPSSIKQDEEIGNINMEAYYSSTGQEKSTELIEQEPQEYYQLPSWQLRISNNFEFATRTFSNWYRLYLPDPLQKERNLEWIPPDEYYHGSNFASKLSENILWNDISSIKIDYQLQSLILESFNTALILLNQNRQILDKLAYELLIAEVLHQPEIDKIIKNIQSTSITINDFPQKPSNDVQISQNWGLNSRKTKNKKISLNLFSEK